MHRLLSRGALLLAAVASFTVGALSCDREAERNARLAAAIETHLPSAPESVRRFYEGRDATPLWREPAQAIRAILDVDADGLDPAKYRIDEIEQLLAEEGNDADARLDIVLTGAYLALLRDLRGGETENEFELLAVAGSDPAKALDRARPRDAQYAKLRESLARHRDLEPWPTVPAGPALAPGSTGERVAALRARLGLAPSEEWDDSVSEALAAFQERHGLEPDGKAGRATLQALNVPLASRIDSIVATLERRRAPPRELQDRRVEVNVPAFTMTYFEDDEPSLTSRVIVGTTTSDTPVLHDAIEHVVLNPEWNVPRKIVLEELVPKIQADPSFLTRDGWRVTRDGVEVDPAPVEWYGEDIPFALTQEAGPANPLGRVKFVFPNNAAVYLHDTPNDHLFDATQRAFSHGCIRLERPMELASELTGLSLDELDERLADGKTKWIKLKEPVAVHLVYWTAWVDASGRTHFREDLYRRDARARHKTVSGNP